LKKCLSCGKNIPRSVVINGNTHNLCNRKFCIECNPFKSGRKGNIKIEITFFGKECICNRCGKTYVYERGHGHSLQMCGSCYVTLRRQRYKEKCIELKGGKCILCGYNRSFRSLHFHHLYGKDFSIKESLVRFSNWEKVKEELEKCILVCANCHGEIHDGFVDISHLVGGE